MTASFTMRYAVWQNLTAVLKGHFESGLPFDLPGPNGQPLMTAEQSRAELQRRSYRYEVIIELLDLEQELPGTPDRRVKLHAMFDAIVRYNSYYQLQLPPSIGQTVINIFDML